jgi:hypothetical protein
MIEPKLNFIDRDEWLEECRRRGFEGPYEIWGNPPGREQFVWPKRGGTAALFNNPAGVGVCFEMGDD